MPELRKDFTAEDACRYGEEIGIDWSRAPFDVDEFQAGMNVELEHGLHDQLTLRRFCCPATFSLSSTSTSPGSRAAHSPPPRAPSSRRSRAAARSSQPTPRHA
jgi:hypothetical protein